MPDLVVTDIGLRLGDRQILSAVSLNVPAGKVTALLGPAGSGKTTLLKALAGLERPQTGIVRLGDSVVFDAARPVDPAADPGLGFAFEFQPLWPHRTVFDNAAYGLVQRGTAANEIKARVGRVLEDVGLARAANRYPHELPAGHRLGVALARTLACAPPLVLLDDPLADFDGRQREQARAWLRMFIATHALTVLIATREAADALALAERVTLLNAGAVVQDGAPAELYEHPITLFAAEYTGSNNLLAGQLVELSHTRAVIDVGGNRFEGVPRTGAAVGEKATGVIRIERVRVGGGPGANRLAMKLTARMYRGERAELVFAHQAVPGLIVRAYANVEPRYDAYHVEFPPEALWVF